MMSWDFHERMKVLHVNQCRLLVSLPEFETRVGGQARALGTFIQVLTAQADSYWTKRGLPECNGLIATVGIKPGRQSRIWCDAVEGPASEDSLRQLEQRLGMVAPLEIDDQIALTVEASFGDRKVTTFPMAPKAWSDAVAAAQREGRIPPGSVVEIPDGIFALVWPD